MTAAALYIETQKFRQPWLWGLLIGLEMIYLGFAIYVLHVDTPTTRALPVGLLAMLLLPPTLLLLGFGMARLEIQVDQEILAYRWAPFQKTFKVLPWIQVKTLSLEPYPGLGLGLRATRKFGYVIKAAGKYGLYLELEGGQRLLIGTRDPQALHAAIDRLPAFKQG